MTSAAAVAEFCKATGALPQGINWAVKSDLAIPLFDPPSAAPESVPEAAAPTHHDRMHAVALVKEAVCAVIAER